MNVNNVSRRGRKKKTPQHAPDRRPKVARVMGRAGRSFLLKDSHAVERQAEPGADWAWQGYPAALKLSDSYWSYRSHQFVCLCYISLVSS